MPITRPALDCQTGSRRAASSPTFRTHESIIPPGNPRIGPRRGQAEGKTIGPQDQLGIPVRIGRPRLAGDGREPVIHDQLGFPGGVGRHRGSRIARDFLWILDARSGASIQLFEDLPVGGAQLDEGIIRAAAIRSSVPDADPECVLDLVAGAPSGGPGSGRDPWRRPVTPRRESESRFDAAAS